jgi:hypothetical protein
MFWGKTKARLASGERVLGRFELAGSGIELPGSLSWSAESGAMVEVVEPTWKRRVGTENLTIDGGVEESDAVTLHDAIVRTTTLDERVKRVGGYILVLGGHIDQRVKWEKAEFGSINLAEWRGKTGLSFSSPRPHRRSGSSFVWRPPESEKVGVRGAQLRFKTKLNETFGDVPSWAFQTDQCMVVDARRPMRVADFVHR